MMLVAILGAQRPLSDRVTIASDGCLVAALIKWCTSGTYLGMQESMTPGLLGGHNEDLVLMPNATEACGNLLSTANEHCTSLDEAYFA